MNSGNIRLEIIGIDELVAKIDKYGKEATRSIGMSFRAEAEAIMTTAKEKFVPVVTGNLRASGKVQSTRVTATTVEQVLGFGGAAAAYAFRVHENQRSGHTGGRGPQHVNKRGTGYNLGRKYRAGSYSTVGQWKYLEQPAVEAAPGIAERTLARMWAFS